MEFRRVLFRSRCRRRPGSRCGCSGHAPAEAHRDAWRAVRGGGRPERRAPPGAGAARRAPAGGPTAGRAPPGGSCSDRKSVVEGKSVSVRVDLGGRRVIKKKNDKNTKDLIP